MIDKANNLMFAAVATSAMVVVFSLLSAKALLSQSSFQHKVLKAKNSAVNQLKSNLSAANTLKNQFDVFEKGNPNIIGGQGGVNTTANGPSDGDNARIVLDALPSQYDFPALTSSLEKIVNNDHVSVQGIGGTDNSGPTSGGSTATSTTPTSTSTASPSSQTSSAQSIPFTITAQTSYANSKTLILDFERSIRPIDITNLVLQGSSSNTTVNIQANTYYQPGVSLQISHKELKQ